MDLPPEYQQRVLEELESDRSIVFVMSREGEYLSLLGGTNRKLFADGSRLIGKSYHQVLKKEKADFFQSLIDEVIRSESIMEKEYELVNSDFFNAAPDGPQEVQKFHSTIIPFRQKKEMPLERVLWIVRNIT